MWLAASATCASSCSKLLTINLSDLNSQRSWSPRQARLQRRTMTFGLGMTPTQLRELCGAVLFWWNQMISEMITVLKITVVSRTKNSSSSYPAPGDFQECTAPLDCVRSWWLWTLGALYRSHQSRHLACSWRSSAKLGVGFPSSVLDAENFLWEDVGGNIRADFFEFLVKLCCDFRDRFELCHLVPDNIPNTSTVNSLFVKTVRRHQSLCFSIHTQKIQLDIFSKLNVLKKSFASQFTRIKFQTSIFVFKLFSDFSCGQKSDEKSDTSIPSNESEKWRSGVISLTDFERPVSSVKNIRNQSALAQQYSRDPPLALPFNICSCHYA